MSYQVKLEVFEGPFDLLLTLIARRQVDVTEVDLAEITADFLRFLEASLDELDLAEITADFLRFLEASLDELDLDTATRFLVVAATLIELKAARLLPAEEREELDDLLGQARDLLYARLLEYRAFRDVSRMLAHRLAQHEHLVARDVPPEPWIQRLLPNVTLSIDLAGLAALAAATTAPSPEAPVDLTHIRRSYLTIREAALQVLDAVAAEDGTTTFRDLVADRTRGDRVVLFLAVLELCKLGHVDLEQPDLRGPLALRRRTGGGDLDAIVDEDLDTDEPDADRTPDAATGGTSPDQQPADLPVGAP